jgi:hypothetical protein
VAGGRREEGGARKYHNTQTMAARPIRVTTSLLAGIERI